MKDTCPACFADAMQRAASELRENAPPATLLPAIERSLAQHKARQPRHPSRVGQWLGWSSLGTACAALCVMLLVYSLDPAESTPAEARGFVAVGSDASQAGAAWLMPAEMSQARLVGLGLPYDPTRAGERTPAQVLVQDGGEVLAVRVMH